MPNFLPTFQLWLQTQNFKPNTVRNYLVDIRRYLRFSSSQNLNPNKVSTLTAYLKHLSADSNQPRRLASLARFCQFLKDQGLVTKNILKLAKKSLNTDQTPELTELLKQYQIHLVKHHKSTPTIRNYLNDIKQFINWSSF